MRMLQRLVPGAAAADGSGAAAEEVSYDEVSYSDDAEEAEDVDEAPSFDDED
jgi:hypothetical protein